MQVVLSPHANGEQGRQGAPVACIDVGQMTRDCPRVAAFPKPQAFERGSDVLEEEGHYLGQKGVLAGVMVIEGRARDHRHTADIGDAHMLVGLGLARLHEA